MAGPATDGDGKTHGEDPLAKALGRLNAALDQLSTAVDQAESGLGTVRDADETVQLMSDDRASLAKELDASEGRAARLAEANGEVSRRLVGAMEMVRSVLDQQKSA